MIRRPLHPSALDDEQRMTFGFPKRARQTSAIERMFGDFVGQPAPCRVRIERTERHQRHAVVALESPSERAKRTGCPALPRLARCRRRDTRCRQATAGNSEAIRACRRPTTEGRRRRAASGAAASKTPARARRRNASRCQLSSCGSGRGTSGRAISSSGRSLAMSVSQTASSASASARSVVALQPRANRRVGQTAVARVAPRGRRAAAVATGTIRPALRRGASCRCRLRRESAGAAGRRRSRPATRRTQRATIPSSVRQRIDGRARRTRRGPRGVVLVQIHVEDLAVGAAASPRSAARRAPFSGVLRIAGTGGAPSPDRRGARDTASARTRPARQRIDAQQPAGRARWRRRAPVLFEQSTRRVSAWSACTRRRSRSA